MSKLSDITRPGMYCVETIEDRGEETIRLKRLGICENRMLEVLLVGNPMIVRVIGTRIGVSLELARAVTVINAEKIVAASDIGISETSDEALLPVGTI